MAAGKVFVPPCRPAKMGCRSTENNREKGKGRSVAHAYRRARVPTWAVRKQECVARGKLYS